MRLLLIPLLLAGCATYSYNDALGSAYATVDALARSVEQACGAPAYTGGECIGSISSETRDQAAELLGQAHDLLGEARAHQVDGSADLAQQRIAEAQAVLRLVAKLVEVRA